MVGAGSGNRRWPGAAVSTGLGIGCSLAALLLAACQSAPREPILTEDFVDLDRFMGDWYVIAHIPTRFETEAYNAVESYERVDEYRIKTVFTYREGGFDGELKRMEPTGFVEDKQSNAVWGMRFVWPFRADYRIVYVDDDYSQAIIGREKRDYAWIMARDAELSSAQYDKLVETLGEQGYDLDGLRPVPQRWNRVPGSGFTTGSPTAVRWCP